jgi:hypothetical protein
MYSEIARKYIQKNNALKKRKWIISQLSERSVKNIALAQKVSRITFWKIRLAYKKRI